MAEATLDGHGVLVTRPQQQAPELIAAIEKSGGVAVPFPVIAIAARAAVEIQADADKLRPAAISIFVSRNAVEHGLAFASGQLAAIGPTTADAIIVAGKPVDICPASGFDSEHLLAEPALQDVDGKTVRIIRGGSGRELLADRLRQRGANVDYLDAYERTLPGYTSAELAALEQRWQTGDIAAVVVMSVQSLDNLAVLLPAACLSLFGITPLVTPAARVLKEALKHNPGHPVTLAAGPRSEEIVAALVAAISSGMPAAH